MKKILCFVLLFSFILSLCVFSALAVEEEDILKEKYLELYENETDWIVDDIVVYDYAEKNGVTYFSAEHKDEIPKPVDAWVVTMGDWCVGNVGYRGRYGIILYVMVNDTVYPAETAWESGLVTDFSPAKNFTGMINVELLGDVDANGTLNIKDATWIQKKLAGVDVSVESNDGLYSVMLWYIQDFNEDETLNIKDATAIQKYLAGIVE